MKVKTVVAVFVFTLAFFAVANMATIGFNIFFNMGLPVVKMKEPQHKTATALENMHNASAQVHNAVYTEE